MESVLKVGTKVILSPRHWLRPRSVGTILEFLPEERALVAFDEVIIGKGFIEETTGKQCLQIAVGDLRVHNP
jgi:hypothetical protein